ncbi:MAG: hypothetical protein R3B06_11145 [Kofleriaceae bacterium]
MMARRPRRGALALALALAMTPACDDAAVTPLTLRLIDDVPACPVLQLGAVVSVELVAIGATRDGADCQLARACLAVARSGTLAGLEAELAAAPQPVLDVSTASLSRIRVRGFPQQGCAGEVGLCGIGDPARSADGQLEVPVVCDGRLASRCPTDALPACP